MLLSYKNITGQKVLLDPLGSSYTPPKLPYCVLFFLMLKSDPDTRKHMGMEYLLHNKFITSVKTYKQFCSLN